MTGLRITRAGRARIIGAMLGFLGGGLFAAHVWGQQLVADLSSHLIAISAGFIGTEVVLFGTTSEAGLEGASDVTIVVTGPRGSVTVRRKDRVAGIWVNADSQGFSQVPSFYMVAASRPLNELAAKPVLERHQIGVANMQFQPVGVAGLRTRDEMADYRQALVRNKQRAGLYGVAVGQVAFLGGRLFRTNIYFPSNVPTGLYNVEVMLIRDGEVVSAQTTPLVVSKVGFSADVYDFAHQRPLLYGLMAVIGAVLSGWLAGAVFRRN